MVLGEVSRKLSLLFHRFGVSTALPLPPGRVLGCAALQKKRSEAVSSDADAEETWMVGWRL